MAEVSEQDSVRLELDVMDECLHILAQLPDDGQQRVLTWLRSRTQDDQMRAAEAEHERRTAVVAPLEESDGNR